MKLRGAGAALQASLSRFHILAAFADVLMIKPLGDSPSMRLLVAPMAGIWVTSRLCGGDGEGCTDGLKSPFHPQSDGTMQQGTKLSPAYSNFTQSKWSQRWPSSQNHMEMV